MSLKSLFSEQIEQLRQFMDTPGPTLHAIRHDIDTQTVLEKILVKLDDDSTNDHIMLVCSSECQTANQYAAAILQELADHAAPHADACKEANISLPAAPLNPSGDAIRVLASYVSEFANCLPSGSGCLVVILHPDEVANPADYRQVAQSLAAKTKSQFAKYIVFDRLDKPLLGNINEDVPRASFQEFQFTPSEMQKRVREDLQGNNLTRQERRQYTAMVGGFEMGKQNYVEAEQAQRDALTLIREDEALAEEPAALYNLANTLLAQDKMPAAEEQYGFAIEAGIREEVHGLVAMALTNLAIALQRQGKCEQALESLAAAESTFRALNNPPGLAYALDNRAQILHKEGRNEEAEQAWLEALAVYEGIDAEMFSQVKDKGQEDILTKLKTFYEATNQAGKAAELRIPKEDAT